MSKIPEDIMGKDNNELGAKKPDFGIFEKIQNELDNEVDQINAKADAAGGYAKAAAPAGVNVEKIMDSRTRRSLMSDTMEIEPQGGAAARAADRAAEAATGTAVKAVEETAAATEVPKAAAEAATGMADKAEDEAAAITEKASEAAETIAEEAGAVEEPEAVAEEPKAAAAEELEKKAKKASDKTGDIVDRIKSEAEEAAEGAADKAEDAAGETADKAEEAAEGAADKAADTVDEARATADDAVDAAKDAADDAAGEAKDATGDAADAARGAAAKAKADIPSDPRDVLKDRIETAKRRRGWQVLLIEAVVIVLAVVITFTLILGSSTVKGTSMEPNYFEGDRVLYFRMASNFEQNDVIIFHTEENRDLIKRVIAVAGDVVDIDDGEVLVNGTPVESLNVSQETEKAVSGVSDPVDFPLTVEEGHVFVLGDNRSVSIDSRTKKIGQISVDDIAGRVFYMMRGKTK